MTVRWLILTVLAGMLAAAPKTGGKTVVLLSIPHVPNVRAHTNVGRALANMGHDVYVVIPEFMLNKMVDVGGINVVSYGSYLGNVDESLTTEKLNSLWIHGRSHVNDFLNIVQNASGILHQMLSDAELIAKLRDIRPDLFLLTSSQPFTNIFVLPYMLNVSFAHLSPYYDVFTNRILFSMSSTVCQSFAFDTESIVSRLANFVCHMSSLALEYFLANNTLITEFAPHMPKITINELARKSEIFLVENDHILDFPKPELPNTKLIGSTAPSPGKPLQEPFKSFADNSEKGVAVVTFGSIIVNIPDHISNVMLAAFKLQELNVIWRVNFSSPKSSKILTSAWIPQNDILAHYNTRLFVSHCGSNGQYEALYHGVPLLCLPVFGDQFYNAHRATIKGFGLDANILEISGEQLASLMREVVENKRYVQNIKKASTLYRHIYKEPVQTAAFWIDYVLKWGDSYMRPYRLDMPLYKFLCLDIIGSLLVILAVLFFIVRGAFQCYRWLCCNLFKRQRKPKTD